MLTKIIFAGSPNFVSSTAQDSVENTQSKSKLLEGPPGKHQKPYFDDIGPKNVTAVVGQSTLLNCRVKHPGDRTVSVINKTHIFQTLNVYTFQHFEDTKLFSTIVTENVTVVLLCMVLLLNIH